jgi:hypothetical protein
VTNNRDVPVTYRLSSVAAGLTLTGLPAQVTLAAGAAQTFPVVLTAGAVTESAYFEIDVDGGDSSNTASAVTEVNIGAGSVAEQPPVVGAPAAVSAVAGDGQSATVGSTFAQPLTARVVDAAGHPVAGVSVTFTAGSGATFTPGGTTSSAVTGSNGQATSAPLKAGTTSGPVTITATTGSAAPAAFTVTVTEKTTSRADLTSSVTLPATAKANTAFKVTLNVTNKGPATAGKTVAVLTLPAGITVRDAGGGRVVRGAILFDLGQLGTKVATSRTVTVVATPTRSANRAFYGLALSATPDPNLFNNPSRATVTIR